MSDFHLAIACQFDVSHCDYPVLQPGFARGRDLSSSQAHHRQYIDIWALPASMPCVSGFEGVIWPSYSTSLKMCIQLAKYVSDVGVAFTNAI